MIWKFNNEFKNLQEHTRLFCVKHPVNKRTHVHARCTSHMQRWQCRTFVLASFCEILYLPSFVFRKVVREGVCSLFSPSPILFTAIFFSPVLPRLMAHFKRRNCSQFISGMQSATQRYAQHPQSSNTISSPIKQHQRQSSTPHCENSSSPQDSGLPLCGANSRRVSIALFAAQRRMINPYPDDRDQYASIFVS